MNIIKHHNLFTGPERDPLLRRVERDAIVACAAMAAVAAALAPVHVSAAAGVVGGGALAWISYRGIKGGIDAVMAATEVRGNRARNVMFGLVKFFTRYAILAAVAYVIMARLGLPPVAVVAGASSLVIAIAGEAARSFRRHPGAPRAKPEHQRWRN
jgi:hypothetical protein